MDAVTNRTSVIKGLVLWAIGGIAAVGCESEQPLPKSNPAERNDARPAPTLLAAPSTGNLAEQIRRALAKEPTLRGALITVDHDTERLRLRGFVMSDAQQANALAIARHHAGDRSVDIRFILRGRSGVAEGPLPHQPFFL